MSKMKKYFQLMLLVIMMASCSDDFFETGDSDFISEEVTFTFGVTIPSAAMTRAMDGSESPEITSLYVVVFGKDDHMLKQSAQASPMTGETFTPDGDGVTYFKVTLNTSEEPRTVHLIANYDVSTLAFGSEGQRIGMLKVTGDQDVYWQRVEDVPIQKTAENATDEENVILAPPQLQKVPLVRNYAQLKVSVKNSIPTSTFEFTGYAILSKPLSGTVAPRITQNNFVNYWKLDPNDNTKKICQTYSEVSAQNYSGNEPNSLILSDNTPSNLVWYSANESSYLFERTNVDATNPTSVLIKGKFSGSSTETYYKVDIAHQVGNFMTYYNILRNFIYHVEIDDVKDAGYTNPQDAIDRPACNNISGSTLVSSFTNISDGEHQLYVDKATVFMVSAGTVEMKFRYKHDLSQTDGNIQNGEDYVTITADYKDNTTVTNAADKRVLKSEPQRGTTDDDQGWRTLTLTANAPESSQIEQNLIISTTTGLMRTVKLILHQPWEMDVECTPEDVYQMVNQPVTVKVYLPESLPSGFFPLEFVINTADYTLYPQANTDMPTKIMDNGSFGFVKKLTENEYNMLSRESHGGKTMVLMPCLFMTNKPQSGTTVTVSNPYFTPDSDSFTSTQAGCITNIGITGTERYGENQDVALKYTLSSTADVTITYIEGGTEYPQQSVRQSAGEYNTPFKTKKFKGDISIRIEANDGTNTQTLTISCPKRRHLLYFPKNSFTFDEQYAGHWYIDVDGNGNPIVDDQGNFVERYRNGELQSPVQAVESNGHKFEWIDYTIIVDNVEYASGSGKIYFDDGLYQAIDIDATYGGRKLEFEPTTVIRFTTYYNQDSDGSFRYGTNTDSNGHFLSGKAHYAEYQLDDLTSLYTGNDAPIEKALDFSKVK